MTKLSLIFNELFIGAARLTQIMLPLVRRASGRIVFLSSGKLV